MKQWAKERTDTGFLYLKNGLYADLRSYSFEDNVWIFVLWHSSPDKSRREVMSWEINATSLEQAKAIAHGLLKQWLTELADI